MIAKKELSFYRYRKEYSKKNNELVWAIDSIIHFYFDHPVGISICDFLYLISEAKILNFLGETEQNEYIVQNYYMTIKEEDGVTYLKEIIMY